MPGRRRVVGAGFGRQRRLTVLRKAAMIASHCRQPGQSGSIPSPWRMTPRTTAPVWVNGYGPRWQVVVLTYQVMRLLPDQRPSAATGPLHHPEKAPRFSISAHNPMDLTKDFYGNSNIIRDGKCWKNRAAAHNNNQSYAPRCGTVRSASSPRPRPSSGAGPARRHRIRPGRPGKKRLKHQPKE